MSTPCPQCGRVSVSGQVHHLCPHGITCRTEGPCLVCEHDMRGAPLPKHLAALLLGSTRRQRRVIARAGTTGRRDARRVLPRPRGASPISVLVASFMLRRQMALDFADAMQTEFRIVNRVAKEPEFYEGIRAVVIDKDNAPKWNPPTLEAVGEAKVAGYFAPLAASEELKL